MLSSMPTLIAVSFWVTSIYTYSTPLHVLLRCLLPLAWIGIKGMAIVRKNSGEKEIGYTWPETLTESSSATQRANCKYRESTIVMGGKKKNVTSLILTLTASWDHCLPHVKEDWDELEEGNKSLAEIHCHVLSSQFCFHNKFSFMAKEWSTCSKSWCSE